MKKSLYAIINITAYSMRGLDALESSERIQTYNLPSTLHVGQAKSPKQFKF